MSIFQKLVFRLGGLLALSGGRTHVPISLKIGNRGRFTKLGGCYMGF